MARWGARKRSRGSMPAHIFLKGGGIRYNGLLMAGDVEANPRPDDYQVNPPLIPLILEGLQCPTPIGDAFARPHNALFHQPRGAQGDAMSRSWRTSLLGPLWLNPPFHMLGDVERKIRKEGAYVILICPGWRKVLPGLLAISKRHYRLPPGPTFRREGRDLLPQRDWPTYALLIDHCPDRAGVGVW